MASVHRKSQTCGWVTKAGGAICVHAAGCAGVAKLVNAPALDAGARKRLAGSNPATGTEGGRLRSKSGVTAPTVRVQIPSPASGMGSRQSVKCGWLGGLSALHSIESLL